MIEQIKQRSWGWMLRNIVLPSGDKAFGQNMMRRLAFLRQVQWWEPEQIRAEQQKLLGDLLQTVYREVPFYRETMDKANIVPDAIRCAEDLRRFPVQTKAILRSHYPDRLVRNTGQKTYETSTSGSTGTNFFVREDYATAGWYRATFLLDLEWAG